MANFVRR